MIIKEIVQTIKALAFVLALWMSSSITTSFALAPGPQLHQISLNIRVMDSTGHEFSVHRREPLYFQIVRDTGGWAYEIKIYDENGNAREGRFFTSKRNVNAAFVLAELDHLHRTLARIGAPPQYRECPHAEVCEEEDEFEREEFSLDDYQGYLQNIEDVEVRDELNLESLVISPQDNVSFRVVGRDHNGDYQVEIRTPGGEVREGEFFINAEVLETQFMSISPPHLSSPPNNELPAPTFRPFSHQQAQAPVVEDDPPAVTSSNGVENPVSLAVRRFLTTNYQSCHALDEIIPAHHRERSRRDGGRNTVGFTALLENGNRMRRIYDLDLYNRSHPVMNALLELGDAYPDPPDLCRNMLENPIIYGYGSKTFINGNERRVNPFNHNDTRSQAGFRRTNDIGATHIDCSGVITAAFAASGLKFHPSHSGHLNQSTRELHALPNDPNSCIERATLSFPNGIEEGDMVNRHNAHVIVIDEVGEDPLGVLAAQERMEQGECANLQECCNSINPRQDFNFTFIHSGGFGSYGLSRVDGRHPHAMGAPLRNYLLQKARMLCLSQGAEVSQQVSQEDRNSIIRHKGTDECRFSEDESPYQLEGEDCIENCDHQTRALAQSGD